MKQEITFSPDCVFISEDNDEILDDLIADLFVEFVNKRHGKQVIVKKGLSMRTREEIERLIDEIIESSKDNDEDEKEDV